MNTTSTTQNPFKVFTPEDMHPEDVANLFVDVFTDFPKIRDPGHTIVNGPRGCGKSMIFRYMLPDCQLIAQEKRLHELPFFSVLVSIKNTLPNLTEFRRIDDQHARYILSEHVLSVFIASKVFTSLAQLVGAEYEQSASEVRVYYKDVFCDRLRLSGWNSDLPDGDQLSGTLLLKLMRDICDKLYGQVNQFARRLSFPSPHIEPYSGALCGYMDFLYPLLAELRQLSFTPSGPSYLLIDDADYLSLTQTQVLNSWISTRTSNAVSIKVSTQLRYKTLATIAGLPIQSPHDYQEVSISDVYTARGSNYMHRVRDIVVKRLIRAGITSTPEAFFPDDAEQEQAIAEIAERLKTKWPETGRGYRADDDVTRYARPEYFKSLAGTAKSTHSYSYSGFQQLVDISSNLIRFFLEPAAQMFDEEASKSGPEPVTQIRQGIQNKVVRAEADRLMFEEFERLAGPQVAETSNEVVNNGYTLAPSSYCEKINRLQRLLRVLGGTFRQKLISDDAERRVFSVALSGFPHPDLVELFELGVSHGYFHRSTIGNKDGTGRTRLYVMSRRLAPHFNLDASSFAGYLWVKSAKVLEAIENPDSSLRKIKQGSAEDFLTDPQGRLFE